ncbi:MAG: helix-turn-helix transcriptional regulator [Clostridia bacterium]|nr:helix-turn-helix transcriptional regulator [Clostridia bacterium]
MISINVDELKLLIINRGLTIDKVADLLDISRKTIYNKMYSKNKRFNFTPAEAKKLAEILNIDASMLL